MADMVHMLILSIGKNACVTGSVLDYLLLDLSDSIFPKVKSFEILEFDPILSDVH